jgi:1-acyl-sn-glycerol-3-phosphate acyltransferase
MTSILYQNINGWQKVIRFVVFNLIRFFYPKLEVRGREKIPARGPIIFILNHPNGLMDPILLMAGLGRPVAFLAKSTLFGNPVGKTFCETFGALPIYRSQDEGLPGGDRGDAAVRNEATFARCRRLLGQGGAMALFPEGTTHSGSQLLQLRTGAARIALSAEAEMNWQAGVQIVPVGLWYESKIHFRTAVLLVVGEPFTLTAYAEAYATDPYQAVKDVTRHLEAGLAGVVLQAENAELLAAIPVLAAWTAPNGAPANLPQQHEWSSKLLATYHYLQGHDPEQLEQIAQQAWAYARRLRSLGISDPWTLEQPLANPFKILADLLLLLLTFPLALLGLLLSYGPYRLAGPVATWLIGKYDTQVSTFKLIGGSLFVLLGWLIEASILGSWLGWGWGLLLVAVAPPLSYLALRWGERRHRLSLSLAGNRLRLRQGELSQALLEQRQALVRRVLQAVQTALG